jgi:uncharacterized protein YaaN involved in tellurite resistance
MLKDAGLTDEQIEKVMTLHGVSMQDYMPKAEVETQVAAELAKKLGDANIDTLKAEAAKVPELEKKLSDTVLDFGIDAALGAAQVVNPKAVRALLDHSKIKVVNNKVTGVTEQLDELKKTDPWITKVTEPTPPKAPPSGGTKHGAPGENLSDEQAILDAKYNKNPYYKKPATTGT